MLDKANEKLLSKYFFIYAYGYHRYHHSFPTRRSSDLVTFAGAIEVPFHASNTQPTGALVARSGSFPAMTADRKSTRLNSSHRCISYAVFCLKKKRSI